MKLLNVKILKKIALYSILFIAVALTTATGVVLFNKKPNAPKITIDEPETSVVSSVVSAAMNVENYKAAIEMKSTDGTIDLTANISLLDIANDAKANISLSGKAFGSNLNVSIKCVDSYIYILYNDTIGLKIKMQDLTDKEFIGEIIGLVSQFIKSDAGIDFDVDKITESLLDVQSEQTKTGNKLTFSLPDIGDFVIETDENYLPIAINAPSIELFGKTISFSLVGSQGNASNVVASTVETDTYLDISNAKGMIVGIIKTLKKLPMTLSGEINILGATAQISLFVDKYYNMIADVKVGNMSARLTYYNGTIYANICGAKLKGTFKDLIKLFGSFSGLDIDELLSTITFGSSSFSVAGTSVDFDFYNSVVQRLRFSNSIINGELSATYEIPSFVEAPQDFGSALNFSAAKKVIDSYFSLIKAKEVSIMASGSIYYKTTIPFKVYGYLDHDDYKVSRAYVGGNAIGTEFFTYFVDNNYYVKVADSYVKFSSSLVEDVYKFVTQNISKDIPKIEYEKFAEEQIKSLIIGDDLKTINVVFACGLTVNIEDKSNKKEITIKGTAFDCVFDCTIAVFRDGSYYNVAFDSLNTDGFADLNGLSNVVNSTTNTIYAENSEYKGNVVVDILDTFSHKIGVEVKIKNLTGDYEVRINITNLPATALINSTSCGYLSQRVEIIIKAGNLHAVRYAKAIFSKKEKQMLNKTYKLSELTADSAFEIFDIGGIFGKSIKKAAKSTDTSTTASTNIFDYIKLMKSESLIFAELKKSLLSKSFEYIWASLEVKDDHVSTIKAKACTKKGLVKISLNLEKQ